MHLIDRNSIAPCLNVAMGSVQGQSLVMLRGDGSRRVAQTQTMDRWIPEAMSHHVHSPPVLVQVGF